MARKAHYIVGVEIDLVEGVVDYLNSTLMFESAGHLAVYEVIHPDTNSLRQVGQVYVIPEEGRKLYSDEYMIISGMTTGWIDKTRSGNKEKQDGQTSNII